MQRLLLPLLAAIILAAWGGIATYHRQPKGQDPPATYVEVGGGQYGIPAANGTVAPRTAAPAASPGTGASHPAATREQIEQEYINQLQTLASGYEARLSALASSAALEIEIAKKADPDADIGPLTARYHKEGTALEAECDAGFYQFLAEFESELAAGSYPLDAAIAAKEFYEAQKSARAGQLTIK